MSSLQNETVKTADLQTKKTKESSIIFANTLAEHLEICKDTNCHCKIVFKQFWEVSKRK